MINDYILLVTVFLLIAIVIFGMWLLHHQFTQKIDQVTQEIRMTRQKEWTQDILQRKLHAYERLALLLERLQFPNVIRRCYDQELNTRELIDRMKMDIQAEYDHNIT